MRDKRYYRSDTVPQFKQQQVIRTLHHHGYNGKIVSIKNTRVDLTLSFKVILKDSGGITGNFLVNIANNDVVFKGTISLSDNK